MKKREFDRYIDELKTQLTHEIPASGDVWESVEPLVIKPTRAEERASEERAERQHSQQHPPKAAPSPTPVVGKPAESTHYISQVIKDKLEALLAEKNDALARCVALQERLKHLDPGAPKLASGATTDLLNRIKQDERQSHELEFQLDHQKRETAYLKQQLETLTRQTDLLRMARDSAHATIVDLQRKLEEQDHRLADAENALQDEIARNAGPTRDCGSTPPPAS